jgi:hypothetical protein
VLLVYRYAIDTASVARTVWTGLHTARSYGLTAAKYGLVPLTLEEQVEVVRLVEHWTEEWTAIPAFYVDAPLVTGEDVFGITRCKQALLVWLEEMKKAGVPVVLVDSPDRVSPRRLVKDDASDARGVLTLEEIAEVVARSREHGIHVLWSGGITPRQAFSLASLGVFGIFTTSSTARPVPVSGTFVNDPVLAFENEPTEPGVRRVHALIQAGFLAGRGGLDPLVSAPLRAAADRLIDATADNQAPVLAELEQLLLAAWPLTLSSGSTTGDDATQNELTQKGLA